MDATRSDYRCPLCAAPLSRDHYEKVLHIDEARKKELSRAEQDLAKQRQQLDSERKRIAEEAAAATRKAVAEAKNEALRLQQELKSARGQLAQKTKLTAAERDRIIRQAAAAAKATAADAQEEAERLHEELSKTRSALAQKSELTKAERGRIAREAAAAARQATAEARKDVERLEQQLEKMRATLAKKGELTKAERSRVAREAAEKAEAQYDARISKLEEERHRAEERRHRDAEMWKEKFEELQRRAEAHDRLHFGPEGEEQLEEILRRRFFPPDDIERKGRGGDVIHTVIEDKRPCGKIVYECKRTANWQANYVRQLKHAMELHGTRYGVLVSRALPRRQRGLCIVDGVIVVAPPLAHHVASILRDTLLEVSRARLSEEGKAEKTSEVYRYLRSEEFRTALLSIKDRMEELRASLVKERSSHENWWSLREQHYGTIARHTAGINVQVQKILASAPQPRLAPVHRLPASP